MRGRDCVDDVLCALQWMRKDTKIPYYSDLAYAVLEQD